MEISQSRRDFLAGLSAAGAAVTLGGGAALADEGPPETTTIRLAPTRAICLAPVYIAEDLLRAEGFTDIRSCTVAAGDGRARRNRLRLSVRSVDRLSSGCRRAGHGVGGRAFRVSRGVRA